MMRVPWIIGPLLGVCVLLPLGLPASTNTVTRTPVGGRVDFDRDGLADPVQYHASNGLWTVCLSAGQYAKVTTAFGGPSYAPLAGDYDGDGKSDLVIYDTNGAVWVVLASASAYQAFSLSFGAAAAVPVYGDFDGDGRADPALYEAAAGVWTVLLSSAGHAAFGLAWGGANDIPVSADFDGDGWADPALYTPAAGDWSVLLSAFQYLPVTLSGFGGSAYTPVAADFDGDRLADPAVYGTETGLWYFKKSGSGYALSALTHFGGADAMPLAGDYDGDGQADPALYAAASTALSVFLSGGNYTADTLRLTNTVQTQAKLLAAASVNEQTAGLLYCAYTNTVYAYGNLRYRAISHTGGTLGDEEVLYDNAPISGLQSPALVLDSVSEPHVFLVYLGTNITHLYRSAGVWRREKVGGQDAPAGVGSTILARVDGRGARHVLVEPSSSTNTYGAFQYLTDKNGVWQSETLRVPKTSTMYLTGADLAVDANGNAHLAIGYQDQISQEVMWPGYLYYLGNSGGSWVMETVAQQAAESWDAAYRDPSIAIDGDGTPAIAAHLRYNVITGSDALSELLYAVRAGAGGWTAEIVADTADDYFGSDGGQFTGLAPVLTFDSSRRANIYFSDLASSHVSGYEQAVSGQIRRARKAGGVWSLVTLYRQSAAAEEGLVNKVVLPTGDGAGLDILATLDPGYTVIQLSNYRRTVFTF